jgi:hypothetical protein
VNAAAIATRGRDRTWRVTHQELSAASLRGAVDGVVCAGSMRISHATIIHGHDGDWVGTRVLPLQTARSRVATNSPRKATLLADAGISMVVISSKASEGTRRATEELAMLSCAAGAKFDLVEGYGQRGRLVGTPSDFDAGPDAPQLAADGFDGREVVLLRVEDTRVLILEATERGVATPIRVEQSEQDCSGPDG